MNAMPKHSFNSSEPTGDSAQSQSNDLPDGGEKKSTTDEAKESISPQKIGKGDS